LSKVPIIDELKGWTKDEAMEFIGRLLPHLEEAGFTVALTGSLLLGKESKKDLDLIVFPINASNFNNGLAHLAFEKIGMRVKATRGQVARTWESVGSFDTKHVEVWWTEDKRRIDVFYLK